MATQVWYHDNCYDGFGAAWAVRCGLKLLYRILYVPCAYGNPMPEYKKGDDIIIVDFSFPRNEMLQLNSEVKSLLVLDHHKTAEVNLKGLDFAIFDMERSGAGMAWDYFMPGVPRPKLIDHIEDRDLWRFKLEGSKEVHAYLCSQPFNFERWSQINNEMTVDAPSLYAKGAVLLQQKINEVGLVCKNSWLGEIDGYSVAMVNTSAHWSEVGHALLEKYPEAKFAASFTVFEDNTMYSLRGRGDFDVSEVAKKFGGGGHKSAAGFKVIVHGCHKI